MSDTLGIRFDPAEWPHGLQCIECGHVFRDGERYSERLCAVGERDVVVEIVCVECALVAS